MTRSELEIIIKKRAAVVIGILAAFIAINGFYGNSNSGKVLSKTIAANNQWAWYQAKNVRSVIYETAAVQTAKADDKRHFAGEAKRMRDDMTEIQARATKLEAERDKAQAKGPFYTYAGIALQLGVVAATLAILAVFMPVFWASIGVGSFGILLFLIGHFGV